jgi:hypothetical protein
MHTPTVAPAGSRTALFGTNPNSVAGPRSDKTPVCYDMATSAMAFGDARIAPRDGRIMSRGSWTDWALLLDNNASRAGPVFRPTTRLHRFGIPNPTTGVRQHVPIFRMGRPQKRL